MYSRMVKFMKFRKGKRPPISLIPSKGYQSFHFFIFVEGKLYLPVKFYSMHNHIML